jgi:hypothetical protein
VVVVEPTGKHVGEEHAALFRIDRHAEGWQHFAHGGLLQLLATA